MSLTKMIHFPMRQLYHTYYYYHLMVSDNFSVIAPRITGFTSVVSSSTLIYLIMRSDTKLSTVYHRIMLGMSISDILASTAMGLTTLPMPTLLGEKDYGRVGIRLGNEHTCRAQGFLFIYGVTAMYAYNCTLCIYYACVIGFKMQEQKIVKKVEKYLHLFPFVMAGLMSIPPLLYDGYWVTPFETWCTVAIGEDVGKYWVLVQMVPIFFFIQMLILVITIFGSFGLIIWRVLQIQSLLNGANRNVMEQTSFYDVEDNCSTQLLKQTM